MGNYKTALSALVFAVMVLFATGGCATTPLSAKPSVVSEQKADWRSQYDMVDSCYFEGRARVLKDGKMFHVDCISGKPVYPELYDEVGNYFEGRARVRKDGKEHHIDQFGESVYPEQYDYISPYSNGRSFVWKDGENFYIDRSGKRIKE